MGEQTQTELGASPATSEVFDTPKVEASTGLPQGQVGPVLEKGFIAEIRRGLSEFASKFKTPKEQPKTGLGEGL